MKKKWIAELYDVFQKHFPSTMQIFDSYINFIDWFYDLDWTAIMLRLKVLSFFMIVLLIWGHFILYRKMAGLKKAKISIPEIPKIPKEKVNKSWKAVLDKLSSPNPSDWNLAVLQADSILDDIFKRSGFAGETMGDRLKKLDPSKLSSLNDVWAAHKIRNVIAHDPSRPISRREVEMAIESYEKALRELEFLI